MCRTSEQLQHIVGSLTHLGMAHLGLVMLKARPEAVSRARPSQGSRAAGKPWETASTAYGSGFYFLKP